MQPLKPLGYALLRTLRDHLRPLIAYHLLFTLLASAVVLPLVAWGSQRFMAQLNRTVVTNDALLALLFSPLGLFTLLAGLAVTFLLIYWQQAGMLQVASRPKDNHYRLALEALWLSTRRLPALLLLVILQVGAHLLLLAPFMAAIAWLYDLWLSGLDPYYLQRVRPPVLWYFIACALPVVLLWMSLASWLYLRWLLALPLVALAVFAVGALTYRTTIRHVLLAPELNQMQVHHGIDLGFATGVRTLLRQDPDVIMIGEIRDAETAEIAVKAAQTGHLVLSTLHTNSTGETLTRLMHMGIPGYLLADCLKLIVAQRLVRRLCRHCRYPQSQPTHFPTAIWPEPLTAWRADGCEHCFGGYYGRIGVYELLAITPEIQAALLANAAPSLLANIARDQGQLSLLQAGLTLAAEGSTSLEELYRVIDVVQLGATTS